ISSAAPGSTTGLYSLQLRLTPGAPLLADLTGGFFRLGSSAAAWGDTVSVAFAVENRGAADAPPVPIQLVGSGHNPFPAASSLVLHTIPVAGLTANARYSSAANYFVTLPDALAAQAAGFTASGPMFVGLRIDPVNNVPEANPFGQSGVHRGTDWESLT